MIFSLRWLDTFNFFSQIILSAIYNEVLMILSSKKNFFFKKNNFGTFYVHLSDFFC